MRLDNFFIELERLMANGRAIVAIEGGSASGKTTLASVLENKYKCTVFHMDDFFLRPEQRNKERFAEIGGNIDRERFLEEVLIPLKNGFDINYRKFDCSTMSLGEMINVKPEKLIIIEGAYSMHYEFEKYYNFSVFLNISADLQIERILKRNSPQFTNRFFQEWIPLENIYFEKTNIKKRCNMIIDIL